MRHLLIKELLQFRRNTFLTRLVFIFPIMIMCVMPWVMNMEIKGINVVVVDRDHSTISERLVHRIEHSNYFIFKGTKDNYDEAMDEVETTSADIIVEIPMNYERDIVRGEIPAILIAANAVNGTKGSLGSSYMSSIVAQNLSEAINRDVGDAAVTVSDLYLYNKNLDYKFYMIPALLAMLLMMMCGFMPTLNIVGEKEAGTMEQMNVTPVNRFEFILAKLIPYWGVAMIALSICFFLSWLLYGIVPVGSVGLIYLISLLLALVFSGFGLVVSNYSDTMQQAIFVMFFFISTMILLCGLFTPINSMPKWAQILTYIMPMRYYNDAVRTVFVRGGTFLNILPQIITLFCFAVAMDLWAVFSYRKKN